MKQNLPTQFDQADIANILAPSITPAVDRPFHLTHKFGKFSMVLPRGYQGNRMKVFGSVSNLLVALTLRAEIRDVRGQVGEVS